MMQKRDETRCNGEEKKWQKTSKKNRKRPKMGKKIEKKEQKIVENC